MTKNTVGSREPFILSPFRASPPHRGSPPVPTPPPLAPDAQGLAPAPVPAEKEAAEPGPPVLKGRFLPPSAVLPPGGTIGPHPSAPGLHCPLSPLALRLAASSWSYGGAAAGANYWMEEVSGAQPPETLLLCFRVTLSSPSLRRKGGRVLRCCSAAWAGSMGQPSSDPVPRASALSGAPRLSQVGRLQPLGRGMED